MGGRKSKSFQWIGIVVILMTMMIISLFYLSQERNLKVVFLDVGQGDAVYIRTPQGYDILIDGGPDNSVLYRLPRHMPWWDHTLDLVVLSHPDADHLAGQIGVLERYRVGRIIETGVIKDNLVFNEWRSAVLKNDIPVYLASRGDRFVVGKDIFLEVLSPSIELIEQTNTQSAMRATQDSKLNNTSLVVRLVYGESEFLFTGDIEEEAEHALVLLRVELGSDVLKVAHHGSRYSTTADFLQAVHPLFAVIQVGEKNRFGHPHPFVLQRLKEEGIEVWRTDEMGDVIFFTDGEGIWRESIR